MTPETPDPTARDADPGPPPAAVRWRAMLSHPLTLLGLGTLLIVAVLWIATARLIDAQYREADRSMVRNVQNLADLYEAQVLRAAREIDQTLSWVAHAVVHGATLQVLSDHGLPVAQQLVTVMRFGSDGRLLERAGADIALPPPAVWSDGGAGTLQVSRPWQAGPDSPWRVAFARENERRERIVAVVEVGFFVSAYDRDHLGDRGVLALLRRDGRVVAWQHGAALRSGGQEDLADLAARAGHSLQGQAVMLDGTAMVATVRELFGVPLTVVLGLSVDEQRAAANWERRRYLWMAGAMTLALLSLSGLLGRMNWLALRHRRVQSEARMAHARQIEHLAYHDSLTGLANRSFYTRLLEHEVAQARRQQRSVALMFLDLDRFKLVNDTLGHDVGDGLLQEVARRLQAAVREGDVVARLGGDEFVVLLSRTEDEADASQVARRVLARLAPACEVLGHELRITASLGLAFYPRDGLDEQTLAKHADIAMYQAKQAGRNNFQFYDAGKSTHTLERLALESALRGALSREELRLHYQARRDVASGRLSGAEALLRWQHPDLGLLPAGRFITLAEETGLIVQIGRWALRTACQQHKQWREHGLPPVRLAINLSLRQFDDDALLNDVQGALRDAQMDPQCLELEIPETVLMGQVERHLARLDALKRLGVRISIDNFGTGYASLATLRRASLDSLKIDRSLIRDVGTTGADQRLPAALIEMGHSLSMTVVAKGVETEDQAVFLREHDCNELQGHYFIEPLAAAAFESLLQDLASGGGGEHLAA
jgi:diguanylate cyclase (GGDEF)-like protein